MNVAVDIDGVIADPAHRLHFVEQRPKNWDEFYARVSADTLLRTGYDLAWSIARYHHIIYLTGRPLRTLTETCLWLTRHDLPTGEVRMRLDDDHRPAWLNKHERLMDIPDVALVVDDDPKVCEVLHNAGYVVLHARWCPSRA